MCCYRRPKCEFDVPSSNNVVCSKLKNKQLALKSCFIQEDTYIFKGILYFVSKGPKSKYFNDKSINPNIFVEIRNYYFFLYSTSSTLLSNICVVFFKGKMKLNQFLLLTLTYHGIKSVIYFYSNPKYIKQQ